MEMTMAQFNALIEYIDDRIDYKVAEYHGNDPKGDYEADALFSYDKLMEMLVI